MAATPRHYQFSRPWGIPVRYHDFRRLRHVTNLSLIEFHLSYKDMELDPQAFLDGLEGKPTALCTVEEAVQTLKFNLAALESARSGKAMTIP